MKFNTKKGSFEEHYAYMQSVLPRLLKAERIVDEIKNSYEWKRNYNYFQTLYNRGKLAERPMKRNGYKIVRCDDVERKSKTKKYVKLSDLTDILTPEQMERVEKLAREKKGD